MWVRDESDCLKTPRGLNLNPAHSASPITLTAMSGTNKRTCIRLGNATPISAKMIDDVFLGAAFVAYRTNPGIERVCKALKAYFAMPSTLEDLGEQGMLDEYSQWEYRVFKFSEKVTFPEIGTTPEQKCGECRHVLDDMRNIPKWIEQGGWPMPFLTANPPPVASTRMFLLFKHLICSRGLYYFLYNRLNNPFLRMCACPGSESALALAYEHCQSATTLLSNNLRGTVVTKLPSIGSTFRYEFKLTLLSDITFCRLSTTAKTIPDGSPKSKDIYHSMIFFELWPFERRNNEVHREYFAELNAGIGLRPSFVVDNLVAYMAYFILRCVIAVPSIAPSRGTHALSPDEKKVYFANATLEYM